MNIQDCLKKGFLKKIEPDEELVEKELKEAIYDLNKAEEAFKSEDHKWSIIKCYYSMFHSAKSVLFKQGLVEKKHIAAIIVLEQLNKDGKLESKHLTNFKASMSARKDADYSYTYSKEVAEFELECAKEFLKEIKKLITKL